MEIGLLLHAAGIGEDGDRRSQEAVHVEITQRLTRHYVAEIEAPLRDPLACPGVDREYDDAIACLPAQELYDFSECGFVFRAFGPMHRGESVRALDKTQPVEDL